LAEVIFKFGLLDFNRNLDSSNKLFTKVSGLKNYINYILCVPCPAGLIKNKAERLVPNKNTFFAATAVRNDPD
jgi:hypothetical protein